MSNSTQAHASVESLTAHDDGMLEVWRERLSECVPSLLPNVDVFKHAPDGAADAAAATRSFDVAEFCPTLSEPAEATDIFLALVALYGARVSTSGQFVFGYIDETLAAAAEGAEDRAALVPFRVHVEATDTFADVVKRVRTERRWVRHAGPMPLEAFDLLDQPEAARDAWLGRLALVVSLSSAAPQRPGADLSIELEAHGGQAQLRVHEDIDPELAARLTAHLGTLAASINADPSTPVNDLCLLPEDEARLVVHEWNQTDTEYVSDGGLIRRFERMVEMNPDHPAVVFRGEPVSYAEFNRRVNMLAAYLRSQGVGPDTFVGLCLDRSFEMVAAIWAVLKAGGAYVPLNVEDPPQRLAATIADAQIRLVLTQDKFMPKLPTGPCQRVVLSPDWERFDGENEANPWHEIAPESLAYMIYTSGSTGKPKGVLIEHAAIDNRILWMQDAYRLNSEDRVIQKTPYTFDVSVWEFLWPLTVGATIVVAEPAGHMVPSYLARLIRQERVTCAHFVPSMLRLFLEAPGIDDLPLRMVFCSGEALPFELTQRFFEKLSSALHNLYGPTEAAVDVSYWECLDEDKSGRVPIGVPVANTQLYVLDEALKPVPVGVPGELYIGGVQLARGYWARPDLTAERFIDSPFAGDEGARLYKTGDVVRFLRDGNIEYLGRNDHQVKINGIRIELGEIESLIRRNPSVRDVVVMARPVHGKTVLVAYLIAEAPGDRFIKTLTATLADRLPQYMLPRAFHFMDAMPLTVSGKVDRKALPEPAIDEVETSAAA